MKTILIVDDSRIAINSIISFIKMKFIKGIKIVSYLSGESIVNGTCKELKNADLLILDYMMPKLNGVTVAKYLYENNINIPIVFITAIFDEEIVEHLKSLTPNIKGVIRKPFDMSLFENQIKQILNIK